MKKIAILGASGHGKVVAEIAELNGFDEIIFFDDTWIDNESAEDGKSEFPWEVRGDAEALLTSVGEFDACVVGLSLIHI